jgi:hypothetical protein
MELLLTTIENVLDEEGCNCYAGMRRQAEKIVERLSAEGWMIGAPPKPLTREELQMLSAAGPEEIDTTPTQEEWHLIEENGLPTKSFEINREGSIRNKYTKRIVEPRFDIDFGTYRVELNINGAEFSLDGRSMADDIWNRE